MKKEHEKKDSKNSLWQTKESITAVKLGARHTSLSSHSTLTHSLLKLFSLYSPQLSLRRDAVVFVGGCHSHGHLHHCYVFLVLHIVHQYRHETNIGKLARVYSLASACAGSTSVTFRAPFPVLRD